MEFITIRPATAADLAGMQTLLTEAGLPLDDLERHWKTAVVAQQNRDIVGCAALEMYGTAALLRSVAVAEPLRNTGLGTQVVQVILEVAFQKGVTEVYLLTETAVDYFSRFGFQKIEREEVTPAVQQSVEFTTACPDSAQAMRLNVMLM